MPQIDMPCCQGHQTVEDAPVRHSKQDASKQVPVHARMGHVVSFSKYVYVCTYTHTYIIHLYTHADSCTYAPCIHTQQTHTYLTDCLPTYLLSCLPAHVRECVRARICAHAWVGEGNYCPPVALRVESLQARLAWNLTGED